MYLIGKHLVVVNMANRKYEPTWLSSGSTLNIHQGVLKSANLLHKQGFVDSQMKTTVPTMQVHSSCSTAYASFAFASPGFKIDC